MKTALKVFIPALLIGAGIALYQKDPTPAPKKSPTPSASIQPIQTEFVETPDSPSFAPPPKAHAVHYDFIRVRQVQLTREGTVLGVLADDNGGGALHLFDSSSQTRLSMGARWSGLPFLTLFDSGGLKAAEGTAEGSNNASILKFFSSGAEKLAMGLHPEKAKLPVFWSLTSGSGETTGFEGD